MKKIVVLLVVAAMLATPAFAVIRNSKHDLSSSGGQSVASTNVDETCVFCHTPHGGATGILAPLWNRSVPGSTFAAGDLYNSATLDQVNSNPTTVLSVVNNSDAPLCLSCHDGGSLAGGLLNPPASNGNVQPIFPAAPNNAVKSNSNLGATLVNDHPIGMDYDVVQPLDGGLVAQATVEAAGLDFYTPAGVMWCSTCHDVHNQGAGQPFLVISNAGSAMCTTCHIK